MLVGVDGSSAAAAALEWAGRLARRVDAEILVTNIFEPDQAETSPDDYEKLIADAEQRLTEEWAASLRETNVQHRCIQLAGAPRLKRRAPTCSSSGRAAPDATPGCISAAWPTTLRTTRVALWRSCHSRVQPRVSIAS
jgi:hypothetical protein